MQTHKYKGKLFDVEYSSVKKSDLYGILRLNSEFYETDIVEMRQYLIGKNATNLGKSVNYIKRGIQPKYSNGNIKVLRSVNIRENGFSDDRQEYVSLDFYNSKKIGQIEYGDVLLTSTGVGTLGRASIHLTNDKFFIDGHITAFRELKDINSSFLYSFLNSKIGQSQIDKLYRGTSGQIEIYPVDLSEILVPIPSKTFQQKIEKLVIESYKQKEIAEKLYKESEELLLKELDFLDYKPKTKKIKISEEFEINGEENHSITNYSILKNIDRFDAEYWDYGYEEIISKIKNYKGGYGNINDLINISKEKITLDEEKIYNYIELADINKSNGMVEKSSEILGKDLPSRARMKIEKGDVLFSSLEGSIDKVAIVDLEKENLVASTGFFVCKESVLNKETLMVLLKIFGKKYISMEALGTIMASIPSGRIDRIVLPKIEKNIKEIIEKNIKKSFDSKNKSKKLLEVAKKAVEIYIENEEKDGMKYINNNL